jgi:catechol 2,3-dioxygenase-like lactoylglutathione lyase family enzyme
VSTATSIITGVDFVSVPTNDLDATMEFYGDVLGLPRSGLWQRAGEQAVGAEFETGTVTVALVACGPLGITFQPNKAPLALQSTMSRQREPSSSREVCPSPPRRSTAASRIPTATR